MKTLSKDVFEWLLIWHLRMVREKGMVCLVDEVRQL